MGKLGSTLFRSENLKSLSWAVNQILVLAAEPDCSVSVQTIARRVLAQEEVSVKRFHNPIVSFAKAIDDVFGSGPQQEQSLIERLGIEGIAWRNLAFEFPDPSNITVKAPRSLPKTFHYSDFGLADKRGKTNPNTLWGVLLHFARNEGVLNYDPSLRKPVSRLVKHLQEFIGIPGKPILYREEDIDGNRHVWRTEFHIIVVDRGSW